MASNSVFDDLLRQAPPAASTKASAASGTVYGPGGHVASPWSLDGILSTIQDAGNQVVGAVKSASAWMGRRVPSIPTALPTQTPPGGWMSSFRGALNNAAGNVPTAIQGIQQARSLPTVLNQAQQSTTGK